MVRTPAARPLLLRPLLASCEPSSALRPLPATGKGDRDSAFRCGPQLPLWREERDQHLARRLHARPGSRAMAI
jgi:hypothetical protein